MPGVVTERDVRVALKSGAVAPVYLLVGDDETAKDGLVDAFAAMVEPELRSFNVDRFYANEVESSDVAAAASTLPFAADRRVVLVLRAEHWFKAKGRAAADDASSDDDDIPAGTHEALEHYLKNPSPRSVAVFVAGDVNRSVRLTKALLKVAEVVEYWGLKDEKELRGQALAAALEKSRRLCFGLFREAGLAIDRDALELVAGSSGTDVDALRNTIERLVEFCRGRDRVTAADAKAIVSGEALVNDWAVVNAVQQRNLPEALHQLRLQLDEGRAPHQVFGQLGYWVRATLPLVDERRVPSAVEALMQANVALNSSSEGRMVLERLVVTLCGGLGAGRGR